MGQHVEMCWQKSEQVWLLFSRVTQPNSGFPVKHTLNCNHFHRHQTNCFQHTFLIYCGNLKQQHLLLPSSSKLLNSITLFFLALFFTWRFDQFNRSLMLRMHRFEALPHTTSPWLFRYGYSWGALRQSKPGRHLGDDFSFDFDVFMGHADLSSFVEGGQTVPQASGTPTWAGSRFLWWEG